MTPKSKSRYYYPNEIWSIVCCGNDNVYTGNFKKFPYTSYYEFKLFCTKERHIEQRKVYKQRC